MENFKNYINDLFTEFEFELVVYDEVEYFKKYNNPEFFYPYQRRKTKIGTFSFNILINEVSDSQNYYNYDYVSKSVSFQKSQTCLESNPLYLHEDFLESIENSIENFQWSQINFGGLVAGITKAFGGDVNKFEEQPKQKTKDFLEECDGDTYEKLKYLKNID